ncbi:MAG: SLC26A/SulP transporter family protein [Proteobacteria bacterium]|nr:SLC26A/SulP transporter family protein [Pseudomonadota bacterium]
MRFLLAAGPISMDNAALRPDDKLGKPLAAAAVASAWRSDLTGGLISAALALPLAVGYGMFAFGALGDSYFAHGALAGLYAAIIAGFACVALGDRTTTVYAPRVTTTFFLGALLYQLVHSNAAVLRDGNHLHLVLLAFFAIILLGGAFQALFGLVRLGTLIRFTPHPVMAGVQNAAAALLFLVQLGNVCGFDHNIPFTAVANHLAEVKPLSLVVALTTFVVMWKARAITTKVPPLLVGLGIGCALYFGLMAVGLKPYLGPMIGMSASVADPTPRLLLREVGSFHDFAELLPIIVAGAFALSVVAAIDALLCAKLAAAPGAPKADGNRLLMRLGVGNMLSACFGGITSGINIGPTVANRSFGGKTPLSVLVNAAVLLLAAGVLFPVVSYMPRSVLSATIMVIAIQHIDPWSLDLAQRIRSRGSRHRSLMLLDFAVVALVAILSVTINIVVAVFIGIFIAVALFVVRMSHSNIRRLYRCDSIHSRKVRTPDQAALLEQRGTAIAVLELQGVLFFGSAETLSDEIERVADAATRIVILDLRRVTEIDTTGARILADIQRALARKGQKLGLAISPASDNAERLAEAGVTGSAAASAFADIDRALQWAEDDVLGAELKEPAANEVALAQVDLLSTLSPGEVRTVEAHSRRESYMRGQTIFREGDPGREMFIVTRGRVSAYLAQGAGGDIRLVTFAPGTVFGELAILDAGPRSASVVADDDVVCYVLSEEQFIALAQTAPNIAIKLLASLGRELSGRLRRANRTIRQLES